ncbi:DNA-3-methyladenine glycosylase family protein [Rhizobium sp. LjRoot254]|uniref:DNA-3-methyladenine glycosylase family protein n=1 Tax=Rhizobium sp. LjRoot254 TaxID=3342297 RepID=UPI003ECEA058
MQPIRTEADIDSAIVSLADIDPAFAPVIARAGAIPLRHRPPGYEGLAHIVVSQMVSRASADAIWGRLEALTSVVAAENILAHSVEELRSVGLSRAKESTLRGLAQACADGLDLETAAYLPASEAIATLTGVKGIGPWSAEVFLLFCAGHPDIFPSGDVALQSAAGSAFGLSPRPSDKALRAMAVRWQPCRSIAARVLWAYYAVEHKRDAIPVV